jgi:hypothetical protein
VVDSAEDSDWAVEVEEVVVDAVVVEVAAGSARVVDSAAVDSGGTTQRKISSILA